MLHGREAVATIHRSMAGIPTMAREKSAVSMLAPHAVQPVRAENDATAPIVLKELDKLGYSSDRAELKAKGEAAFSRMLGSSDGAVSAAVFTNHAAAEWGWDQTTSLAAFSACDLDQSGAIGRHEYLLLLAATVHFGTEADHANHTLADVRARCIFMRYHMLYDADPSRSRRRLAARAV